MLEKCPGYYFQFSFGLFTGFLKTNLSRSNLQSQNYNDVSAWPFSHSCCFNNEYSCEKGHVNWETRQQRHIFEYRVPKTLTRCIKFRLYSLHILFCITLLKFSAFKLQRASLPYAQWSIGRKKLILNFFKFLPKLALMYLTKHKWYIFLFLRQYSMQKN